MCIHRHLQMVMFLHFAWEHVAELQVLHRHIQQQTRIGTTQVYHFTELSMQLLFPPARTTVTVTATSRSGLELQ